MNIVPYHEALQHVRIRFNPILNLALTDEGPTQLQTSVWRRDELKDDQMLPLGVEPAQIP